MHGHLTFALRVHAHTRTPTQLTKMFSNEEQKCQVIGVRVPTEKGTNKPNGYAFVEFLDSHSLKYGLALHKTEIDGRCVAEICRL